MVSWGASWSVRLPICYAGDRSMMDEFGGGGGMYHAWERGEMHTEF
jgi:hypothetical protein